MPEKDIARIDASINRLVVLIHEQNNTLNNVLLVSLTKVKTLQSIDSKRIDKLESDKTWLIRLIFGSVIAIAFTAFKVM